MRRATRIHHDRLTHLIVNTYAPQGAKPAAPAERKTPPVAADDSGCGHKPPAARQSRFADAMMSALRELGFGGAAAPSATSAASTATPTSAATASAATPGASTATATPVATTPASTAVATEPTAAKESSASVESMVQQFAHALFQALRQSGGDERKAGDGGDRVEGHGHHRHHHHRRHGEGQGYGDMSQRLEALSQTFGAPAAAAANPANAGAATSSSLSLTLTVADNAAAAPAAVAGATPAPASATGATPVVAAPVAAAAKNPLLDAFTKLFNTLKPAAADTAATTPATDMAEKLRLFLHTLAQALAPDSMGSVQRAQVGGLVNLTA